MPPTLAKSDPHRLFRRPQAHQPASMRAPAGAWRLCAVAQAAIVFLEGWQPYRSQRQQLAWTVLCILSCDYVATNPSQSPESTTSHLSSSKSTVFALARNMALLAQNTQTQMCDHLYSLIMGNS